ARSEAARYRSQSLASSPRSWRSVVIPSSSSAIHCRRPPPRTHRGTPGCWPKTPSVIRTTRSRSPQAWHRSTRNGAPRRRRAQIGARGHREGPPGRGGVEARRAGGEVVPATAALVRALGPPPLLLQPVREHEGPGGVGGLGQDGVEECGFVVHRLLVDKGG